MAYHRYFMNFFFILVISFFLIYPLAAKNSYLVNKDYIASHLTHKAPWADSHDASGHYLGCGMLYYALAYMMRAHVCVCLGSGGGFVPRLMRQAQRDLCLTDSTTILIDGNMGPYGRPKWLSSQSFFKKMFPDITILLQTTHDAALAHPEWKIDYLHIDADHSFEGAYSDFLDYLPLMNRPGVITFHDTGGSLPCAKVIDLLKTQSYEIIDFKELGAGLAVMHLP